MLPLSGLGLARLDPASNRLAPLESSGSTAPSSSSDVKLRKAAGEFESILLESLWKSMKETFKGSDDKDSDPTLESFDDWGIQAMASAVGSSGGLGIKNTIIKYLEPRVSPVKEDTPSVPQARAPSAESN